MAEYIEREATIEKLNRLCDRVCQYSKAQRKYMCGSCPLGDAFTVIEDDIPAADVRPVVLCRDCYAYRRDKELAESAYLDPEMYCGLLRCEMGEDSFCSYGKRKEES